MSIRPTEGRSPRPASPRRRNGVLALGVLLAFGVGIGVSATSYELSRPGSGAAATDVSSGVFRLGPRPCKRAPLRRRYVSSSGSNANPGTLRRPWQTIGEALARAQPGDAVFVRRGRYEGRYEIRRSGTADAPISLRAYPGEIPVLTGRLKISGDYFCVTRFRFDGAGNANGDSVLIYVAGANHDEIFRNRILGASMSGIYVGDESDPSEQVSIIGNYIRGNGTHERLDHGIYLGHVSGGVVANNVVIENMAIGVKVAPEANAITVTQNTVVANRRAGISIGGEESWSSNDNVVVNNIVAFNREWGIRTYWEQAIGHGNLALRNLVFGNGGGPFWFPGGGMAEQQSILANPRFLADGNYRLRRRSPGVNRALSDFSMPFDFRGRSRRSDAGPDLGAYER